MRIRNKPWAKEELNASPIFIRTPEQYKGKWNHVFKNNNPIHIELGCGKGYFVRDIIFEKIEINYIAIDLIDAILGMANRNILEKADGREVKNLILTRYDIEEINNILDEKDNVERIYINFCNPWPKPRHYKRRLTHTRQLEKYKQFLKLGGEIYFKTDDDNLFKDSLEYFENCGFEKKKITYDLANEPNFWNNIETEHEIKFKEQGIKIKAGIFKYVKK